MHLGGQQGSECREAPALARLQEAGIIQQAKAKQQPETCKSQALHWHRLR